MLYEEPIEDTYFRWLCAKVMNIRDRNYWDLLELLHRAEFVWLVPGDQNRMEDGLELRPEFLNESFINSHHDWQHQPCSVLEMLIGLARRANFQIERPRGEWFWEFIENLGLRDFRRVDPVDERGIYDILNAFVWRTYTHRGEGGLFPMRRPRKDQRETEIVEQFFAYLEDRGYLQNIV